jgi:hypothetical protein
MDNIPVERRPKYLSTPNNDNDDMCLLKSSIYFAFHLKGLFANGKLDPESLPDIYLSMFPEMYGEMTREDVLQLWQDENPSFDMEAYRYPLRDYTIDNQINDGITTVFHMYKDTFLSTYYNNDEEIDRFATDVLNRDRSGRYGRALFRSYPVYFPLPYDIQRKLQCVYGVQKPTLTMIHHLFMIHLLKSGHVLEERAVVNFGLPPGNDVRTEQCWVVKQEGEIPADYPERIKHFEDGLEYHIKSYFRDVCWSRRRRYISWRLQMRKTLGFGYTGM